MIVINLTPHAVRVDTDEGVITLPASGQVARVSEHRSAAGVLPNGIRVERVHYGGVEGLPPKREGVVSVVSRLVRNAVPERDDLFCPGGTVRDKDGRRRCCWGLIT